MFFSAVVGSFRRSESREDILRRKWIFTWPMTTTESPSEVPVGLGLSDGGFGPCSARPCKSELRISRGVRCCSYSFIVWKAINFLLLPGRTLKSRLSTPSEHYRKSEVFAGLLRQLSDRSNRLSTRCIAVAASAKLLTKGVGIICLWDFQSYILRTLHIFSYSAYFSKKNWFLYYSAYFAFSFLHTSNLHIFA